MERRETDESTNDVLWISSDSSSSDLFDCSETEIVDLSEFESKSVSINPESTYKSAPHGVNMRSEETHSRLTEYERIQTLEDEIVDVSDEDIGVCGGVVTLDSRLKLSRGVELIFQNYTTIRLPPPVHPHVRRVGANLRPIIIDGSNVSFSRGIFSGRKLKICVRAFQNAGHKVTAFMPQFRTMHSSTREAEVLDELENEGVLILTPSRSVDFQRVTPYDDRYVVEYADMTGGVIVSRDNYCDLLKENEQWKQTINRRLKFVWLDDWILFPKYPLGALTPTLSEFLKF